MPKSPRVTDVLPHIEIDELEELARIQLDDGHDPKDVIDGIVALIDAAVPWAAIIPNPAGAVIEVLDGPVARAIARLIVRRIQKRRARPS